MTDEPSSSPGPSGMAQDSLSWDREQSHSVCWVLKCARAVGGMWRPWEVLSLSLGGAGWIPREQFV